MTMFGERCRKSYTWKDEDPKDLFESDVPKMTRVLVDLYTDDDTPSEGHKVLTFDIEVEMESGLPHTVEAQNTITSIAAYDNITQHYTVYVLDKFNALDEEIDIDETTVLSFDNEQNMLEAFLTYWESLSPTIVTGWNIDFFDIPYLYNRMKNLLGRPMANRLSPIGEVYFSKYRNRFFLGGVSCLDYLGLYKKFTYTDQPSYSLNHISNVELGRGKIEYSGNLDDLYRNDIHKFIKYNIVDVELVVELENKLQYIDLARGICHAGRVPYESYVYSSQYLEGAILSFLKNKNLVSCNKPSDREKRMADIASGVEEKFTGAFVKDPIVGKHEWVYDLDLTSLYPSIIMTLNISPETKIGKVENWDVEKHVKREEIDWIVNGNRVDSEKFREFLTETGHSIAANGVIYKQDIRGCIPEILDVWFNKRVEYKNLMKKHGKAGNKSEYQFFDKRQLVQKILLNSLYGVLGLPAFRFYDVDNAEAVTVTGQSVIKNTAKVANLKYNKELNTPDKDSNIYIDTDSVFFSAEPLLEKRYPDYETYDDVKVAKLVDNIAGEMQDHINKFYDYMAQSFFNVGDHRFEIKKELISRSGFWVTKKRYAQWVILREGIPTDKLEVKGLDVVRSSFPTAFRDKMSEVLIDILKGVSKQEIDDKIIDFKQKIRTWNPIQIAKSSSVKEISKYEMHGITRKIGEFKKSTPAHVKAAMSYNDLLKYYDCPYKYSPFKDGDKVKWVYLKDNPFHLDGLAFKGEDDPPEIIDYITKWIDTDKLFERELKSKLDDFYESLNWIVPTENLATAKKFFEF